jgi:hypothetical protein
MQYVRNLLYICHFNCVEYQNAHKEAPVATKRMIAEKEGERDDTSVDLQRKKVSDNIFSTKVLTTNIHLDLFKKSTHFPQKVSKVFPVEFKNLPMSLKAR